MSDVSLNEITLQFEEPIAELLNWRATATRFLTELSLDAARTAQSAKTDGLKSSTKARLTKLAEALRHNHDELRKLLAPLLSHAALPALNPSLSGAPVVATSLFSSNFVNLFRDWSWSNAGLSDEPQRQLEAVLSLLPPGKPGRVLILGAGSARLAYDLACELESAEIVATEINPLLFLAAKQLLDQKPFSLYEIAELPLSSTSPAEKRLLSLPKDKTLMSRLTLLLNDFTEDQLAHESFDLVLTPWLIDVVGLPFGETAARVNRLLRTGGNWMNLGPLMFLTTERSQLLTNEEVHDQLATSEFGFRVEAQTELSLTQLRSQLSSTFRTDHVFGWRAEKVAAISSPKTSSKDKDSTADFVFLNETTTPVRLEKALPGVDLEELAQTHSLLADVLLRCHENKSVNQIAEELAPDFGLPAEAVRPIIQGVLANFIRSQR